MPNKQVRINCKNGVHAYAKLSNKSVVQVKNEETGLTDHIPVMTEIMVCGICGDVLRPFETHAD